MYNCFFKYFVCLDSVLPEVFAEEDDVDVLAVAVVPVEYAEDAYDFVEDGAREGGRDILEDTVRYVV